MDRPLTARFSRAHGQDEGHLSRSAFPPRSASPFNASATDLSRPRFPRHLDSPSTPNLYSYQSSSTTAQLQVEEQSLPSSRSRLRFRPSIASFSRRPTTTTASPSTPNLYAYHPSSVTARSQDEQLSQTRARSRLRISPSIANLRQAFSRSPITAAGPSVPNSQHLTTTASSSTPNFGQGQPEESKFTKLKSGVKKLLHREPKPQPETAQQPAPLAISGPTSFQHLQLDNQLHPVGILATECTPGSLSIPPLVPPWLRKLLHSRPWS